MTPKNAPSLAPGSPRCQCAACDEWFRSVEAFDVHRIGTPGTPRRRCLTRAEMRNELVYEDGYWTTLRT